MIELPDHAHALHLPIRDVHAVLLDDLSTAFNMSLFKFYYTLEGLVLNDANRDL